VYLVIVFLSVILPMLLLSSKLKRNLIIAQNLTIIEVPPQVNIKLDFLLGVEPQHKPTNPTTKPTKPQLHSKGGFHETKSPLWYQ
jgi:hypothetical protein